MTTGCMPWAAKSSSTATSITPSTTTTITATTATYSSTIPSSSLPSPSLVLLPPPLLLPSLLPLPSPPVPPPSPHLRLCSVSSHFVGAIFIPRRRGDEVAAAGCQGVVLYSYDVAWGGCRLAPEGRVRLSVGGAEGHTHTITHIQF
ncbi:hypothetical protein E2C01_084176 [Portunus trituberculatus]|uniref:Uncharacterized protein n=1 Tax=Portunus trituberculatus TaxID=210409 RepID=A0A5B7J8I8_PORTR|nr:hypothetical protein [Portunus trituberculatus]